MPPNRVMDDDKPPSDANLAQRVQDLEAALKAARGVLPMNLLPENSGGPGVEVAETWSLAEQEAANKK